MSITKSRLSLAITWILPSTPADTTAELPTTPPSEAFTTTVPGHGISSCQADNQPTAWPSGVMEMKFIEYATAAGTPQLDKGTGITRG
jgi:hypothetical protein